MLDKTDKKIIDILKVSGREPASSISEKIGVSVPTVIDRIKKLQETGVIESYRAIINNKKVGYDVSAIITIISESSAQYSDLVSKAVKEKFIEKCFTTTGNGSHVLLVNVENTDSLEKLLRKIQQWPGVRRTETQIILSSYK
ncbi:MAG: AsnC family transcriptional regulator [Candidatus Marinimicrobia bacterium]|nr:AsnC family transcriptional regulator [Candidatus Neomarinimicrobiota bacterium]MAV92972.1 AsnC family transcriptional regulator [Candidatus Neomarinimicrobiota bacterium]MBS30317.1 AsnC family transcriptional regulator [Candidatus Neomarinimicrobiota bacterium]